MRKFITFYYLLFVLLIMGTFASMAQNDYGNVILGVVAFSFSILFGIQFITSFSSDKNLNYLNRIELLCLTLLAIILGLRVFYIHFQWVEAIYGLAGLALIGVQFRKVLIQWKSYWNQNKILALLVVAFRVSIILYLFSMTIVPFVPRLTEPTGELAFALLIIFLLGTYLKRDLIVAGEKVSPFKMINQLKDHSLVLMTLFILFTAYMGLTRIGATPAMYSDELPQAYFELIKQDERESKLREEVSKTEEFKEMYDQFVEKHKTLESK